MNKRMILASLIWLGVSANLYAATFTVTNTLDSGAGSLRQAILNSNAGAGTNTIAFNIPASGPYSIKPTTALPTITRPVVIDGTTQPGFTGKPIIELNGSLASGTVHGLVISTGNSTVRGLVINGFNNITTGIYLQSGGNNVVQGNFLGLNTAGTSAVPNTSGVYIENSSNNLIGGTTPAARNVISGNSWYGVDIYGGAVSNNVQGNFIGTDPSGTNALGNSQVGVLLHGSTSGNTIGGLTSGARNIISGNGSSEYAGIWVETSANGNFVQGNFVGTDVTGTNRLANIGDGVYINNGYNNTFGGTTAEARNIISGNTAQGVEIVGGASSGNVLLGNYIGLDATGKAPMSDRSGVWIHQGANNNIVGGTSVGSGNVLSGNLLDGIYLGFTSDSGVIANKIQGNLIGTDSTGTVAIPNGYLGIVLDTGASNNLVGGSNVPSRNVVSGNTLSGVFIGNGAAGNTVQGNFIGTDVTGMADLGNGEDGIFVSGGTNNTIGGVSTAARNVISANGHAGQVNNGRSGIEIWDDSSANLIQGNFIGTDATGTNGLGNREYGLFIQNSSRNTTGGTLLGAANVVAFNQKAGVAVESGTNNPVRANSIFANAALGIDLGLDGVTENDAGDADSGPNTLQNYPVLSSAQLSSGTLTIRGTLNSRANTSFQLDFYANNTCDSSGYGQGQTYLGSGNFTTYGSGNVNLNVSLTASAMAGQSITATATDPNGNSSEFSHCLAIVSADVRLSATTATNGISVSWPSSASSFRLQSTTNLSPPVLWQDVLDSPIDDGTTKTLVITNDPSVSKGFYRLVYP